MHIPAPVRAVIEEDFQEVGKHDSTLMKPSEALLSSYIRPVATHFDMLLQPLHVNLRERARLCLILCIKRFLLCLSLLLNSLLWDSFIFTSFDL